MSERWFRPYIEGIRVRPGMYLRTPTTAGLASYVDGYRQARRSLGHEDLCDEERDFVRRFEDWLRRLRGEGANVDWPMLVDLVAGHPTSIAEFYELWDRFHDEERVQHVEGNVWAIDPERGAG